MTNPLWDHQAEAVRMIREQPATMLAMDMGTGKSRCVVEAVCQSGMNRTLILAPKSVVSVWPREFWKHSSVPGINVLALDSGTVAKRIQKAEYYVEKATAETGYQLVVVMNYEAAIAKNMSEFLLKNTWGMVVLDESHRAKTARSRTSQLAWKLSKRCVKRVCLSGTPMPHSPLDVFGQYRFLDDTIFGRYVTQFRNRYAVYSSWQPPQAKVPVNIEGYRDLDDLNKKFYSIAIRVNKSDVLDLPPVVHDYRTFDLPREARVAYDEMKKEFIVELKEGVATAGNALAKLLRLQQVTSGYLPLEDKVEPAQIHDGKRQILADILEDLPVGEKMVVFCRFKHDLQEIKRAALDAKMNYFEVSGRCNQLDEWNAAERSGVLGVQIQAGGIGIDLTAAAYCVYYSVGFSLGDYDQSLARLDRPGQTRSVTYIHLIANNTVDAIVYRALKNRKEVVESVLQEIEYDGSGGEVCVEEEAG